MVATVNASAEEPGRDHLLTVVEEMQRELEAGAEWENHTLERFLDGFSSLLRSIELAYRNEGKAAPADPWIIVADVFRGARDYE